MQFFKIITESDILLFCFSIIQQNRKEDEDMVLTCTIKSPKKINKPHIRHWPDHDSAIHASLQQKSEQKTVHLESLRISYSAILPICNVLKDIFAYFYINILLIYEFEYINSLTAMNRPVFPFL